jgi:hypothetical protein
MRQYKQGFIYLKEVGEIPSETQKIMENEGYYVLGYGESFGYGHCIDSSHATLEYKGDKLYLNVHSDTVLTHKPISTDSTEEFLLPVDIDPGKYEIIKNYYCEQIK